MWQWITDNASLWGLIAIPIAVIVGIPSAIQLVLTIRDFGRSTDDLATRLRNTRGRVEWSSLRSTAIGTRTLLPTLLTDDSGAEHDATAWLLDQVRNGMPVLLIGRAGSGKSQMLSELHRVSYVSATSEVDPLIEVVPLTAFRSSKVRGPDDVLQVAARSIARRYRMSTRAVRSLIHESKLVVAFDGLDEVQTEVQAELTQQLARVGAKLPMVVTSRPLQQSNEVSDQTGDPFGELAQSGRIRRGELQPIPWSAVEAELRESRIPGLDGIGNLGKQVYGNALNLQILLFLWNSQRIDRARATHLLREPAGLLDDFINGRDTGARDPALLLAAVMSSDPEKPTQGSFSIIPIQLSGHAYTIALILSTVGILVYGYSHGLWVTATAVAAANLLGGSEISNSLAGRAATLGRGMLTNYRQALLYFVILAVLSYAVVHLARIFVWSVQAGHLTLGRWEEFVNLGWLGCISLMVSFATGTAMSLDRSGATYGRYMRIHVWPIVVLTAGFGTYAAVIGDIYWGLLDLYLLSTCLYLAVSIGLTWMIVGEPPWRWKTLMSQLVQRGILCRDEGLFKFTHARIEETLIQSLASNPHAPRLLWATFGEDWGRLLLETKLVPLLGKSNTRFESRVAQLSHRTRWSPSAINMAGGYYQWIVVDPASALRILRGHLRIHPRSALMPMVADAWDRIGDPRGRTLARRLVRRRTIDTFDLHWPLRVLERHETYQELETLTDRMEEATREIDIRSYIDTRRMWYQLSGEVELYDEHWPLTAAALALESTPPRLDEARASLNVGRVGPVRSARQAQLARLDGSLDRAREWCELALDELDWGSGYDEVLEVMITAAIIHDIPVVNAWVARATSTGLRLRGRPGLIKALGIAADDPIARLIVPREPTNDGVGLTA